LQGRGKPNQVRTVTALRDSSTTTADAAPSAILRDEPMALNHQTVGNVGLYYV
jgi:hypothetical protein